MSKLTGKQEKFCQEILKGKGQTEAYIKAGYSVSNMKNATINNNAYKLIRTSDISTRIEELRKPFEKKLEEYLLYTAENSFKNYKLAQEISLNKKKYILFSGELKEMNDEDIPSFLKAEDSITKLLGINAPDKQEINGNIGIKKVFITKEDIKQADDLIDKEIE